VPLWLLEHPDVTGAAVRVYGELAGRHAEYRSGEAHVSRAVIGEHLAMALDTVDRALTILRTIGAVQVTRRHTQHGHRAVSRYRVLLTPDQAAAVRPRSVAHQAAKLRPGPERQPSRNIAAGTTQSTDPDQRRALRAPASTPRLPWDWPEPRLPFETPLPVRRPARARQARPMVGRLPLLGAVWRPRRADGVSLGVQCPHTPRCATVHACIDRALADGRRAREALER
jgi:hypothetical protein